MYQIKIIDNETGKAIVDREAECILFGAYGNKEGEAGILSTGTTLGAARAIRSAELARDEVMGKDHSLAMAVCMMRDGVIK